MPDRAFIRQTLIELIEADTGEKHDDLAEDANLREGLGLDSVDVVSIVSQIERRFHIRLSQEDLEKLVDRRRPARPAGGQTRRPARSRPPRHRANRTAQDAKTKAKPMLRASSLAALASLRLA